MFRKIISPESLGAALREVRKQKGLNQTAAGKLVGIDQSTVSKVEQGSGGTQLDTLFRLLAALELEMAIQPRNRVEDNIEGDNW
ncbi:transcriptional regulator, XRE family [Malonomonas rubra DSM 5091]|uniref:Transcriptional regulator, XRE family n=1 Tax=Malonomonas rubra DSM 5091 TaxID=1122189 RepID=A0A1M6L9L5_MALRU|nr:helix-turn-helix domain-containing protein [Malonomonas rubra]SHJ67843.1 transcriptional regulator, XRE family [Malonomonas rubra DSM 5091]